MSAPLRRWKCLSSCCTNTNPSKAKFCSSCGVRKPKPKPTESEELRAYKASAEKIFEDWRRVLIEIMRDGGKMYGGRPNEDGPDETIRVLRALKSHVDNLTLVIEGKDKTILEMQRPVTEALARLRKRLGL
jgi:hypothetical protein